MALLILIGLFAWVVIGGVVILFLGWIWTGLAMMLLPLAVLWFLWKASL